MCTSENFPLAIIMIDYNFVIIIFFQVVGHSYDNTDLEDGDAIGTAYETIYALLQCISPSYQLSFHDAVASKLQAENNN